MSREKHRLPGRPRVEPTEEPVSEVILRIAGQMFMEQGYEATTVDAVADACHVTKASVYYYFSSKADLFVNAILKRMENIRLSTSRHLSELSPLPERLKKIAQIRLKMRDLRWDFGTVVREAESSLSPAQLKEMKRAEVRLMNTIAEAFTVSMRKGEIRATDAVFAAHAYVAMLEACRVRMPDGELKFPNADKTAALVVDTFWNGLRISQDSL